MILGGIHKETTDVGRAQLDFTPFLDAGEVVSSVDIPTVVSALAGDASPVVAGTPTLISSDTGVQVMVSAGTAGTNYLVTMLVHFSTSGRVYTARFRVSVGVVPSP
jgi:hypothetical protein